MCARAAIPPRPRASGAQQVATPRSLEIPRAELLKRQVVRVPYPIEGPARAKNEFRASIQSELVKISVSWVNPLFAGK